MQRLFLSTNAPMMSVGGGDGIRTQWRWRQRSPPKRQYPTTSLHGVITQWRWRQQNRPKRWYPTTTLHGVTTQWRWRQQRPSKRFYPTATLRRTRKQKTIESFRSPVAVLTVLQRLSITKDIVNYFSFLDTTSWTHKVLVYALQFVFKWSLMLLLSDVSVVSLLLSLYYEDLR